MKKAVAAITLALSTGVFANEVYIGGGYFDNDDEFDTVTHAPGSHSFTVDYSMYGSRSITITGVGSSRPLDITTNLQMVITDIDTMTTENYLNVSTTNYKWGSVLIPADGASTSPLRSKDPVDKWHNVGVMPCENGTKTCPVLTRHGKYMVYNGVDFTPRQPSTPYGDMCMGGAGAVVYNNIENQWWLDCEGRNGRKFTMPLLEGRGQVDVTVGEHTAGF